MPLFFFDIHDGVTYTRDSEGSDLPDEETARREAQGVLPDIARDKLPDGERRDFIVDLRNADGRYIYTATLSLVARRLGQGAGS